MSLIAHLQELRKRILWSLVYIALAFFYCWDKHEWLFDILQAPIKQILPPGSKLVFMGLTDAFVLYFKVAALAACFLASPFILYQMWRFIAPGLYRRERHYVLPFIFFGTVFFLSGGIFAYKIAFPFAARFLLGMGEKFQPMLTIDRYFGIEMGVILGLGLMFELPIVIFTVCEIGVVTPQFLLKHFRYAVIVIFILAAILTPTPDMFNMCVVATPTLGLYLLGVGAAALAQTRRRRRRVTSEAATNA